MILILPFYYLTDTCSNFAIGIPLFKTPDLFSLHQKGLNASGMVCGQGYLIGLAISANLTTSITGDVEIERLLDKALPL